MDENPTKTRQQLEAQLIDRTMKDETFRQELLRDPKGVFARELGMNMPEHITVQVLEESPSTVYLVLPAPVSGVGAVMSDAELENVAGGGWTSSTADCASCQVSDSGVAGARVCTD